MKGREIALAIVALLIGAAAIVGLFLFIRHLQGSPTAAKTSTADAGRTLEPVPLVPLEPEPDEEEDASAADAQAAPAPGKRIAVGSPDAAARGHDASAPHEAGFSGLKADKIYVHPASNEQLCLNRRTSTHGYTLQPCKSVRNERWILDEDPNGIIRIQGGTGQDGRDTCVHVGEKTGNDSVMVPGPCDATTARFRHEDTRFRELDTNRCLSVHVVEKRAQVVVSPCDPSNQGQMWGMSR